VCGSTAVMAQVESQQESPIKSLNDVDISFDDHDEIARNKGKSKGTSDSGSNASLDSISSEESIYSGVQDAEFDQTVLHSRKIFSMEFSKLKQIPVEKRIFSEFADDSERLRSLLLSCAYGPDVTECVLSLLDPRWMIPCLDEYPAYGIPLEDEVDNFSPYFMRKQLRPYPEFIALYVKRNLLPKEVVPFYIHDDVARSNIMSLVETSRESLNSLMSVTLEYYYTIGMEFEAVVGTDRGRRLSQTMHPILLPTMVFARTLLVHTDACDGETTYAGPFPSFLVRKKDEGPNTMSQGPQNERQMSGAHGRRRSSPKSRGSSSLCSGRGHQLLSQHSMKVQLVDTHKLADGVVLVGPSVMSALSLREGQLVVLKQLPPSKPGWLELIKFRRLRRLTF